MLNAIIAFCVVFFIGSVLIAGLSRGWFWRRK
jgi:hypothetical protein